MARNKPKAGKSSGKTAEQRQAAKRDKTFLLGMIILFIVVAIVIAVYNTLPKGESVAAMVNGEPIYHNEVDAQYKRVPEQFRSVYTKEDLLEQMVERKLLTQEAAKAGTSVTDEELNATILEIESQLQENQTLEDLLKQEGLTMEQLEAELRQQLIISKFIEENVVNDLAVTEQEISDYAAQNFGELELTNETYAELEKFLLLQKQRDAYQLFLNQTRDKAQITYYKEGELKEAAAGEELKEETPSEEAEAATGEEETNVPETEPSAPVETAESTGEMSQPEEQQADSNEPTGETALVGEGTSSTEEALPVAEQQSEAQKLVECLNSKNAMLYGSQSCDFTKEQLLNLGEAAPNVAFVECNDENGYIIKMCEDIGVEAYPTWIIGDQKFKGARTVEQLKEASGC